MSHDGTLSSFGATIFKVMYGINIQDPSDVYLRIAEKSVEGLSEALIPGKYWVDFMPFLKYIPAWVPGVQFQKVIAKFKPSVLASKDAPYKAAYDAWVRHTSHVRGDDRKLLIFTFRLAVRPQDLSWNRC